MLLIVPNGRQRRLDRASIMQYMPLLTGRTRMASVHPIMDALREKRIKRGMTLSKLARVANLSRESIRKRETLKFPSLMVLDRWCRALGYKLTLTEIDPPHESTRSE